MSEQPLQFDRAEFVSAPAATQCANCKQPIIQSYYEANGKLICSHCHEALTQGGGSSGLRVGRALIAGLGAAIVGAFVWWGVRKLTGYEVGIISIGIGIAVGKAVRWGSQQRGGWAYQLLAILLTYSAVALNYMPDAFEGARKAAETETAATASSAASAPKPAVQKASAVPAKDDGVSIGGFLLTLLVLFAISAAAPILAGADNIIGMLIIAFGLFEAWKINKRVPLTINGPFSVAPAAPPASNG